MAYIYNVSRVLLQQHIKQFGHYMKGHVLDAGSGSYNRYKHLLACDSIVRMDIVAGPNVDVVGSADAIPFSDCEFDGVLSTQVFEHLEYPEKAAAEISRVLKHGGYLLVTVPQWNELHEEPHDYWRYTRFGIKSLFERNGFEVVAYEQSGGFFTTRAQMNMRYLIDRFHLYQSRWVRVVSFVFRVWGSRAVLRDKRDRVKQTKNIQLAGVLFLKKYEKHKKY